MSDEIKEYFKVGKKNIIFVYVLYLLGMIIPMLSIVGAVFAYLNKDDKNQMLASHYTFAFRTFLGVVIAEFVAMITVVFLIGPIISFCIFIWAVARSIIALQYLLDDLAYPNPLTFSIK